MSQELFALPGLEVFPFVYLHIMMHNVMYHIYMAAHLSQVLFSYWPHTLSQIVVSYLAMFGFKPSVIPQSRVE